MFNKHERALQIYDALRTARLNVLYYEESLKNWTFAIRGHDIVVALTGVSSPIAFLKHSSNPVYEQAWFYLTVAAGIAGVLKPILRWDTKVALFAELLNHYCELQLELKSLTEDISAERDVTPKINTKFEACRKTVADLQRKEPPPSRKKIKRLMLVVENEYDMSKVWLPAEEE